MTKTATLYYIHDPMCSWCWGFKPVWSKLQEQLPDSVKICYLLGGLARDTSEPMSEGMQTQLQQTWHNIEQHVPGIKFNFNFWTNNQPRRSTYPSCRAVIACRNQNPELENEMIYQIQKAYYQDARNPSDDSTLIELAGELGLDQEQFSQDLNSPETQKILNEEIQLSDQLGAQGYPSLILLKDDEPYFIELDYRNFQPMLDRILSLVNES